MTQQKTTNHNVPKLHFPEFRDAGTWVVKSIGSMCKTFSGGTPTTTQNKFYGGNIPFLRSAEIDQESTELFLTNEGLKYSAANKKG
jgi:type I restriction enzyme, S subunit